MLIGMSHSCLAVSLANILPRFVDRDMIMRYYWGFGRGHVYSHGRRNASEAGAAQHQRESEEPEDLENTVSTQEVDICDGLEFGLEDRENEDLEDSMSVVELEAGHSEGNWSGEDEDLLMSIDHDE